MRSTPRQTASRRVLHALVLACLAVCLSAPALVAQQSPAADGHALLQPGGDIFLPLTQAYGINDGHAFNIALPDACAVEVSALQWSLWRDDRRADFVTVFGVDSAAGRRQLYQRIEGFPPGTVELSGDNTLTLAGETYPPSLVAMLPRSEIAALFPELDLSRLAPRQETDQYAVVSWEDVSYANGRHFGAGFALTEEEAFYDLFARPGRFVDEYITLRPFCVDCGFPADRHAFAVLQPGLEVVAAHYHRDVGTGLHNEVLSVIGLASGLAGDAWTGMRGFEPGLVELRGDSIMRDAAGLEHVSVPRLLSAEQIGVEFPQMDVSNLAGGGLYVVDSWPAVQMALPEGPSEISRVSGSVRVNGQLRVLEALWTGRGNAIGELATAGLLTIDGVPPPTEELLPPWELVIQPSGIVVDADVGILTRPGDRARALIRVGQAGSPIRGVIFQDVVVTGTDPWVTDVEIFGSLQVDEGPWELPFAKAGMDFLVEDDRRASGVATLLWVSRGNSVEIPVTYSIRYEGAPSRELPVRFVGSMTWDTYSPDTGAFGGTAVRQEAAP